MYFIELFARKISEKFTKRKADESPIFEQQEEQIETCKEHVFLPVDSSGEVLSCINCGLVVHKEDLHKTNPF
ncbi:hypothetical protein IJ732_04735 [bacterium]|nr:hypothetical protein [bacterium]